MTFNHDIYAMLCNNVRQAQKACDDVHPDFAHFPSVTIALAPKHLRHAFDTAREQLRLFELEMACCSLGTIGPHGFEAPRH